MSLRVKVKIIRELCNNGDYRIFACSPMQIIEGLKLNSYNNFTIKGELPFLSLDKEYELEIEEIKDKYGATYKVLSVPSMEIENLKDLTREQSFEMLMDVTSSERLANNILDAYPNFIEIILTEGKEAIDVKNIHGVGDCYLSVYDRELNTKYKYYALLQQLKEYEVNVSDCKKMFDKFEAEEKIKKELKDNPYYVLTEVLGRSFDNTDKLLLKVFPDLKNSKIRCEALMLEVLRRNEYDKNSRLNGNVLWNVCQEDYNCPQEWVQIIKDVAIESPLIYYDEESKDLARMDTYLAECKISNFVKSNFKNLYKLDIDWTKYKEIKDGILTDEQSEVLKAVCENNFVVVDAKGGTGKTSSLMAVIEMLEDNDLTYTLLSPTGRVAKRIKEQTNRPAQTVHKAFLQNKNGLYSDIFVLEEGSMAGIDLFCMFIDIIKNPKAKVIVNMDLGQVAPISCGCPMRDIINSGMVKVCTLSKVFRYGEGGLYKMATDAYDKKFYINDLDYNNQDRISVGTNKDYTFVRYDGTIDQIIEEYKKFLKRNISPKDISLITCWNITDFGSINLNNKIQEIVNPNNNDNAIKRIIRGHEVKFKVGDLILNTKNKYGVLTLDSYEKMKEDSSLKKEDFSSITCLMNGENGKILNIDDGNIIAQFDEDVVVIDKTMQDDILLGYCITSYKIQGSETPYAINLVVPQFRRTLNKNFIYTDMSRAKKEVVQIIDPKTLASCISIDGIEDRNTWLYELLTQEEEENEEC